MISKHEEFVLGVALASEKMASEIVARAISATPASPAAAQAILDIIKTSEKEKEQIKEYLVIALTSKKQGEELASLLELIVECLEYQAANSTSNNAALAAAQAKLLPLSTETKKRMVICLADKVIAESVVAKIEAAAVAAAAIPAAV